MKELDLLLERFVLRAFDDLKGEQLDLLERLLDRPDQDLLELLNGSVEPGDEGLAHFARWLRSRIAFEPVEATSPSRHVRGTAAPKAQ